MLKLKTPYQPCILTPAQAERLQRDYSRLRKEQRLNKVDLYDALHGGGYKELRQAEDERDEIELEIAVTESMLQESGVTPVEDISDLLGNRAEAAKLRRYHELFGTRVKEIDVAAILGDDGFVGGDSSWR